MVREWFRHIEFEHAWVLGFLILVPVMIIEYMRRNNRMSASMLLTTTHFIKFAQSSRTQLRHLLFILRCLAIIFLLLH